MEKLVYVLWRAHDEPVEHFGTVLREQVGTLFADMGAHALSVNVADEQAQQAAHLRISQRDDPPAATFSVWLDTHLARGPFDDALARVASRVAAYLVVESVPIPNIRHPVRDGERIPALCTVALLEKPQGMAYEAWREQWQGHHTRVAIETQSTFLYVQNVVVRALSAGAPPWTAVVEECFPPEAATDPMVFYAAQGSREKLEENQRRMLESVRKFIDFSTLESHPMSAYVLKSFGLR
jgi:hypothetical protein